MHLLLLLLLTTYSRRVKHNEGFQGEMRYITYGILRQPLAVKMDSISPRCNDHCKWDILGEYHVCEAVVASVQAVGLALLPWMWSSGRDA